MSLEFNAKQIGRNINVADTCEAFPYLLKSNDDNNAEHYCRQTSDISNTII